MDEERRQRIIRASGARQIREQERHKRKKRRSRLPGEPLTCGCAPEDEEQRELVAWGCSAGLTLFWTRGERRESYASAEWAKQRGALDGMPDLLVLQIPGLMIELKARCSKHRLTRRQEERIAWLRECGWRVLVCHGAQEAIDQLCKMWPLR